MGVFGEQLLLQLVDLDLELGTVWRGELVPGDLLLRGLELLFDEEKFLFFGLELSSGHLELVLSHWIGQLQGVQFVLLFFDFFRLLF